MPVALLLAGTALPAPAWAQDGAPAATYADVLANPDSLEINMRFVRAQLDAGDFEGASITLQRILLISPQFDRARLVRVAVFLRLGDHAAARADLAFLAARPLNATDRAEADRLASLLDGGPGSPWLAGTLRVGGVYESNASLSPGSGSLAGAPFSFATDGAFGAYGELQFTGEVPFGGDGHAIRAEGLAHGRVLAGEDGYSYGWLGVGPRFDLGVLFADVQALGRLDLLGGQYYGHQLGGRVRLTVDVADRISVGLRVDAVHETRDAGIYATVPVGDADGFRFDARPSITVRLSDTWRVVAHGRYVTKDAGSNWFSYTGYGGGLAVDYRSADGISLRLGGEALSFDYDAADPRVGGVAREDLRYTLDAALAVPFAEIAQAFGQPEDETGWGRLWAVEAFTRYSVVQSDVDVYDSANWTIGLGIARRFSL